MLFFLYIFCCLLIAFANSLYLDHAQQNVRPDLDPKCLTLWWYSLKNFSKKLILKKTADNKWRWTDARICWTHTECCFTSETEKDLAKVFLLLNSLPVSDIFCRLLITFANSLFQGHARQNVGPDLDPKCLTLWWYSWKNVLKNLILKKISKRQVKMDRCLKLLDLHRMLYYIWNWERPSIGSAFVKLYIFCRLLISFANSLYSDQPQRNVGPDLDPKCLTLWWYSWKNF